MSARGFVVALLFGTLLLGSPAAARGDDPKEMVELRFYIQPQDAQDSLVYIWGRPSDTQKDQPTPVNDGDRDGRGDIQVDGKGRPYTGLLVEKELYPSGEIVYSVRHAGYLEAKGTTAADNVFKPGNHFVGTPFVETDVTLVPVARNYLGLGLALGGCLVLVGGFIFWRSKNREVFDMKSWVEANKVPSEEENSPVGKRFGKYWVLEKLGQGGMATVYRARADAASEDVALKIVHPHLAGGKDFQARFQREATVGNTLRHPNIITVLDAGEQDGNYYMALEYVKGTELTSCIPAEGLPLKKALGYLLPVFDAVAHAHSLGVVHRDIKPSNVLVKDDQSVKLSDFGLARTHDFSTVTATGAALGTPAYMAPEQIQGHPINPASDQYALGVMTFQLTTGHLPFEDEEVMQLILKHLTAEPPAPSSLKPELPAEFDALVKRMLSKDPAHRFPGVQEAGAALRALL